MYMRNPLKRPKKMEKAVFVLLEFVIVFKRKI